MKGGSTVLNPMNRYNLILLNNDEKCKGLYTWEGRGQKSVIDYALVNIRLYDEYKNMTIDEGKDIMDITGHNLMEIKLKKPPETKKITNETKEIEYYKKDGREFTPGLYTGCGRGVKLRRNNGYRETRIDNEENSGEKAKAGVQEEEYQRWQCITMDDRGKKKKKR